MLDRPGLTGATNAAAMALSTLFALVALALATRMSNGDAYADTVQDYISLMDLSLVTLFVFLWILVVILVKPFLPRRLFSRPRQGQGKDEELDAATAHLMLHKLGGITHHSSQPNDSTEDSPPLL